MHYVEIGQPDATFGASRDGIARHLTEFRTGIDVARALDLAGAILLIVFLLPVLCLVAAAVSTTSAGPTLFAHARQGRAGSLFHCLKFRTMVIDAESRLADLLLLDLAARTEWERSHKLRQDPRVTVIGNFLRKSSLDELPQLFNVIRGEMSLVGPRPIVAAEIPKYGHYISYYYAVRPGMTGLWQVSGRSETNYRRRVAMDVVYVRKMCLALSIRILIMTLPCVMLSKGAV